MALTMNIPTTISAKLVVEPAHGPSRDATAEDLRALGYIQRTDAYMIVHDALALIVGDGTPVDLTGNDYGDTIANLVRYFAEVAIMYHDIDGAPANRRAAVEQVINHLSPSGDPEEGDYVADLRRALTLPVPPAPTEPAQFAGSNTERQSVGLPGHCERCAAVGHVKAHPELGCSDVGCYSHHDEPST